MYALLAALLYPLSLLPLAVLYRLSDLAYLVLYYGLRYRRNVVQSNLQHAFPERSEVERQDIERRFYRSFCDQWLETVKLLTLSAGALKRRMPGNWDVLQDLAAAEKNTYLITGHHFNWEWANVASGLNTPLTYAGIYLPLSSVAFDKLMLRIRTRMGAILINIKSLITGFRQLVGKKYVLGMLADQSPGSVEVAEWLPFLHREAPFFRGPEEMPRRAKAAVVFIGIRKERRGHYRATLEKLCDDASQMPPGSILKGYVEFLERQIHAQPENWLWSHRRWKHVKEAAGL